MNDTINATTKSVEPTFSGHAVILVANMALVAVNLDVPHEWPNGLPFHPSNSRNECSEL